MIEIKSIEEYNDTLKKNERVIVDFTAEWCGPCQKIKPEYEKLSKTYNNIVFCKVDVDECNDIVDECQIECMPTLLFYKNSKIIQRMSGSDMMKIQKLTEELSRLL